MTERSTPSHRDTSRLTPLPPPRLFGGGDIVGLIDARGDLWLSEPDRDAGALQYRREVNLGPARSACIGDFGCWRIDLDGCLHHVKLAPTALRQALGLRPGEVTWVGLPPAGRKFLQMSVGQQHLVALDDQGQLWGWGSNALGQLGAGALQRADGAEEPIPRTSRPVLMASDVLDATALPFGTLVVNGWGDLHVLGEWPDAPSPEKARDSYTTTHVDRIRWVHHAQNTVLVLDEDSFLQGVGSNRTLISRGWEREWQYKLMDGWGWVSQDVMARAATGGRHTVHLNLPGALHTRGTNLWGQLGSGDTLPQKGIHPIGEGYVEVACGPRFTAALRADGGVDFMGLLTLQDPVHPRDPGLALRPTPILKAAARDR